MTCPIEVWLLTEWDERGRMWRREVWYVVARCRNKTAAETSWGCNFGTEISQHGGKPFVWAAEATIGEVNHLTVWGSDNGCSWTVATAGLQLLTRRTFYICAMIREVIGIVRNNSDTSEEQLNYTDRCNELSCNLYDLGSLICCMSVVQCVWDVWVECPS